MKAKRFIFIIILCLVFTNSFVNVAFAAQRDLYIPGQVDTFTAEQDGNCVYFQWTPIKYAVSYNLYARETASGIETDVLLKSISDSSYGYAFNSNGRDENGLEGYQIKPNTSVTFYIKAVTALNVEGSASNTVVVTAENSTAVVLKNSEVVQDSKFQIKNLKATMTSLTMKWDRYAGAEKYIIYRATSKSGTYKRIATTTKTKYTADGLNENKIYYFKVKVIKEDGISEFSNITRKVKVKGDYQKGSVYGPYMSQKKLNKVGDAVADFVNTVVPDNLSDADKAAIAHHYLATFCSYAGGDDYNNAYGALIRKYGQCSGYARAYKALCDGLGVKCWYVHSSKNDHQFNIVKIDGTPYIVDVQLDSLCGVATGLFRSTSEYKKIGKGTINFEASTVYDTKKYPLCSKNYFPDEYYNERDSRWDVEYDQYADLWWC